jgi:hypothetical protein
VPVAKALGLKLTLKQERARVAQMIKTWLGTGALVKVEKQDDRRRNRVFVEVAEDD